MWSLYVFFEEVSGQERCLTFWPKWPLPPSSLRNNFHPSNFEGVLLGRVISVRCGASLLFFSIPFVAPLAIGSENVGGSLRRILCVVFGGRYFVAVPRLPLL